MRLFKVFSHGRIYNDDLYTRLKELDQHTVFPGCNDEFQKNRDWWVQLNEEQKIIAYCGCLYNQGICIFIRAWVDRSARGKGLQKKMIKARIKSAKQTCKTVITYTTADNIHSINNLIKTGFILYEPVYKYSGPNVLYWTQKI